MSLAYLIISAFLLSVIGFIWSAVGWSNIAMKMAYATSALFGAVMIARALAL